jgi:hypothetical protein
VTGRDLAAHVSEGPDKHRERCQEAEGVAEIHRHERAGPMDVDDGPRQHPADADAEVDQ